MAHPHQRAGALLPLVLLCSAQLALIAAKPSRCSACRAVAEELVEKLDAEQPRNHIDLQHRVGPDGKRWGKTIEYKISELRVIHLLEDLCDGMDEYEVAQDAAGERWARSDSLADDLDRKLNIKQRKEQRRELSNFCHDVIEKHEDELSQALRNGEVSSDNASDFLCVKTAGLCKDTLEQEQAAVAAALAAAEKKAQAAAEKAAQQAEAQPAAGTPAAAAAGGDAMQEARSEL